jgi:pyruvate formate lyase activating enzyme
MSVAPSERAGGIHFAALMPHAPILVPEVGRERLQTMGASVAAMKTAAARLIAEQPQSVVVISPHSPRKSGAFGLWNGSQLRGSFHQFGAPSAEVELPNDLRLRAEVIVQARQMGLRTWDIPGEPLDHGALVPLWYLVNAGWSGPTVILSLNYPGEGQLTELGRALADAVSKLNLRVALVASGDMSHRLTPDAPAGYEPRAGEFDQQFISSLRRGAYGELKILDSDLQKLAGEDVLDSTLVGLAAADWQAMGHEVLSYEAPFGVGYGVAVLFDADVADPRNERASWGECCRQVWAETLPRVARDSLRAELFETRGFVPPADQDCLAVRRGVFVTILGPSGELRGCVGTLTPKCRDVVEETRHAVRAAAFSDGRFPPVTVEEFPHLRLEVSVISPLEEAASEANLDPRRYGVVVSTPDGREGCLLPGITEVVTVQQQIELASRKGGIERGERVRLRRFEAAKFREAESVRPAAISSKPDDESHYEADWWTTLADGRIECQLCPRECKLHEGQRGFCFVRQRIDDRLVLTTYGRSSGFCVDPMEKKPLNHFFPGTSVLSFGTAGCNLGCKFCQNWSISKAREFDRLADVASPETIAGSAKRLGCKAVAFTYNDPVIFAEYAIDVAIACHAVGVQTVAVTAGYMNPKPRAEFYRYMDAANVDLKGFTEDFYRKLSLGALAPVLDTLEYLHRETKVWLEVTSLLIPGENDDERQLHWAADWFAEHLGPDVPWHFTAFHPDFKMLDKPPTPPATLEKARTIALSKGLRYVYTGNVHNRVGSSTWCPQCQHLLIERDWFALGDWNLKAGCCRNCGHAIPGRFEERPGTWDARRVAVRLG